MANFGGAKALPGRDTGQGPGETLGEMGNQHRVVSERREGDASERVRFEVAAFVERFRLAGEAVLVAASGGLDSSVLAHALSEVDGLGPLSLGHVHHGLRGADADADADAVAQLASRIGARFIERRIEPDRTALGTSSRLRLTLQEAARAGRYAALAEMAEEVGATRIATAHHANDQAETVLLRLLRGTGPDGLGGIPEVSPEGRVVRPLLRVARSDLEAHAASCELRWREDASNQSMTYARNRLRHEWIPGLACAFNANLLRALVDLAETQRTDSEWIDAQVRVECTRRFSFEGAWLRIETQDFAALPLALSRRVLREALRAAGAGRHTSRQHLDRMQAFATSQGPGQVLELPAGVRMQKRRGELRVGPIAGAAGRREDAC